MKSQIELNGTKHSADDNPRRMWDFISNSRSLKEAFKKAKRLSKNDEWHEIEVRRELDGETTHHSYWQNGRLQIDMSV